ncbi:MAG: ABC transporter ATP-binding protein, partial [Tissierellia bacterium]|nr:ABC transporter ATP-binding protein [Tissierellia bacterium]
MFKLQKKNILITIGVIISFMSTILYSYLLSYFIDLISSSDEYNLIKVVFILLLVVIIAGFAKIFLGEWLPMKLLLEKSISSTVDLMKRFLKFPFHIYNMHQKGYYINVITSSAFTYGDIYTHLTVQLPANAFIALIMVIIAFSLSIYFGILFLLFIPICYLITLKPSRMLSEFQKIGLPTQDKFLQETKHIIDSKREINILKANNFFNQRYKKINDKYLDFIKKFRFYSIISNNLPSLLANLFQVFTLFISAYLLGKGIFSVGNTIFIYTISGLYKEPIYRIFEILIYYRINKVHIDRVRDTYIESKEESKFLDIYKQNDGDYLLKIDDIKLFADKKNEIHLFDGKDISIKKNTLTLIKGSNGTGKSLFINYITGNSEIENAKGEFLLSDKLKDVAYLTYPIVYIDGSFKENTFGREIDQKLLDILSIDYEDKYIKTSPINLSYGEGQKLNLLRVLSDKSDVLILDEPFSNLDTDTIEKLSLYLNDLKKKKTIIAIVHGEQLDKYADDIYLISDHKIEKQL